MREMLRGARRGAAMVGATVAAVARHELRELRLRKPAGRGERQALGLHGWAERVAKSHGLAVSVQGTPPRLGDGVLVVANHVSYLDVIALAASVPAQFLGMMEIASWPLIGPAARVAGMVFVERGSGMSGASALRRIARLLRDGVNVVTFPEGRTSDGTFVRSFSPALFRLAIGAGRAVVPVAVAYDDPSLAWTGDASFLPHYARMARRPVLGAHLSFLDRIAPPPGPRREIGLTTRAGLEAATRARAAIAAAIGARLVDDEEGDAP